MKKVFIVIVALCMGLGCLTSVANAYIARFEAEWADEMLPPHEVTDDDNADGVTSNGLLWWSPHNNDAGGDPDPSTYSSYAFWAPAGEYKLVVRTNVRDGDNSYWTTVEGGATFSSPGTFPDAPWWRNNGLKDGGWHWINGWNNDGSDGIVRITLPTDGLYTVKFTRREGGCRIDTFIVTDDLVRYPDDSGSGFKEPVPVDMHYATNPTPGWDAKGQPLTGGKLTWEGPFQAPPTTPVQRYMVYFGDSLQTVLTNQIAVVSAAGPLEVDLDTAGIGPLPVDTTYYWRVDAYTDVPGEPNAIGMTMKFTTLTYDPVIVTQPASARVFPGETVVFAVEATSGDLDDRGPLSYQWYDSTAALDGETGSELVFASANDADIEDYYCVVSNADGEATSATASLWIKHMIGHWTFDEGTGSIAHDTSPGGPNADATMYLNQAEHPDPNAHWEPNGMIGGCYDGFGGSWLDTFLKAADLDLEGNNPKSVSVWVFPRAMNDGGIWDVGRRSTAQNWCLRTESESQGDHGWRVQYWGGDYNFNTLNAWNTMGHSMPSLNAWIHFVLTHDGAKTKVYANGRLIVDWDKTINTGDDFTFRIGQYGPNNEKFDGLIDDMRLYDFALNHLEATVLYTDVVTDDSVCVGGIPLDLDGDCRIGISDLVLFAADYLECNLVPDCKP